MYDIKNMDKRYVIFAYTFLLANRLQTAMDNSIEGITSKQWFTALMIGSFDEPPTLKQLAKSCDSSHQNTKQIVLKLEENGYVKLKKDSIDKRAMRITTTRKWEKWNSVNEKNSALFIEEMFEGLSDKEIRVMLKVQQNIYEKLEGLKVNFK